MSADAVANRLLQAHLELDALSRDRGDRLFISDWYCEHPFAAEIVPPSAVASIEDDALLRYCFHNDDDEIHERIRTFHGARDGTDLGADEIYVAAGLSGLITAQFLMLRRQGIQRLHYIRPLYYTYYYLASVLGIELVPVNDDPLDRPGRRLELPPSGAEGLILCDPVWHIGRPVEAEYVSAIRTWQDETESLVMVDGAFQYLRWRRRNGQEATAALRRDLTIRNLCPTKTVAVHGPRFAYALLPARMWEDLRYAYANSAGSSSVFDHRSAIAIMDYLTSPHSNGPLLDLIADRYERLTATGAIREPLGAEAAYFCFVTTPVAQDRLITMDQTFFDTTCHPNLVRFNLLLPQNTLDAFLDEARRVASPKPQSACLHAEAGGQSNTGTDA